MKKLLFSAALLLAASFAFVSCDKDEDPQNLVQLAQDTPELSILVDALVRADLVSTLEGDGPFTVFAPSNTAFEAFLQANNFASLDDVPVDLLTTVLLYHVVSGDVKSTDLTTGYVNTVAEYSAGIPLSAYANVDNGVSINDANVDMADVSADNGVVHIIDKVLFPPTVVNQALNNPNFSILVQALTRSDLGVDYVGLLSGDGPFTVFAPTNDAFTALLTELNVNSLDDISAETLNAVLQYHVVNGANVRAGDLTDQQSVTTFGGSMFTINLGTGASITDGQNRTSNIIVTDVQGTNGVVHAIDTVILP